MATWEYPFSEPADVDVSVAAGSVTITAAPTSTVTVRAHSGTLGRADDERLDEDLAVEFAAGRLEVHERSRRGLRWRSGDLQVEITVPARSRCTVRTAAADVSFRGEPGPVEVQTASGDIDANVTAGPAELVTISGLIRVDELTADSTLSTASGQIQVRHAAADLAARTVSGEIEIGAADGSLTARTANGRIAIASVARGRADLNTVSGDIEVAVAPGTGLYLDLSSLTGRVTSELEPSGEDGGADLRLHCRSLSGTIRVARATAAHMPG